jgi:hypothetical protein
MRSDRTSWLATTAVTAGVALAVLLTATGCTSGRPTGPTVSPGSAKAGYPSAVSALSTMAPDAKLLVVQTAQAASPTGTPIWAYLFGSPKTDKTYLVYVGSGQTMPAGEYGTAGLTAQQWASVPGTQAWVMDSDIAYKEALAAAHASGTPAAYYMGFQTYLPESKATSTSAKPFVWYVGFEPGTSGVTTQTIQVDMATGVATISKLP